MLLAFGAQRASAQAVWSEGTYFPDSTGGVPAVSAIPWSYLTHVDYVGGAPQSGGSITPSSSFSDPSVGAAALISAAHAHSVKVDYELTNLGSGTNFNGAMTGSCSSGAMNAFVANIMFTVNSYGFDGAVVDYEESYSSQFPTFMSCLRTAMGSKLIVWYAGTNYQIGQVGSPPVCTGSVWPNGVALTVSGYADRVVMSGYDLNDPVNPSAYSYFNSPLYSPSSPFVWSDDYAVRVAASCGISASKTSISIPFYGDLYSINTAPYQTQNGSSTVTQFYYNAPPVSLSGSTYDSTAHDPWKAGGGGYLTWENAQSITDKINYVYANSLGGWMLWVMGEDYSSGSMPLLSAVGAAFTGGGSASTPTFSPAAGSYYGPQSVAISSATPSAAICWNTTGSPATNHLGTGCPAGSTLYTGPVSVPSSETLYAIAGTSSLSDSSVGSAAYVIGTPPPAGVVQYGSFPFTGSITSLACSPSSGSGSVTAGDVEVMAAENNSGGWTGISSTRVTTWNVVQDAVGVAMWYGVATSSGAETITVTFPFNDAIAACVELNANTFNAGSSSVPPTYTPATLSLTTTVPVTSIIAVSFGGKTSYVGTPFSLVVAPSNSGGYDYACNLYYASETSAGTHTATVAYTSSSDAFIAWAAAAFGPATSTPNTNKIPPMLN
jgi:hypothetical protein